MSSSFFFPFCLQQKTPPEGGFLPARRRKISLPQRRCRYFLRPLCSLRGNGAGLRLSAPPLWDGKRTETGDRCEASLCVVVFGKITVATHISYHFAAFHSTFYISFLVYIYIFLFIILKTMLKRKQHTEKHIAFHIQLKIAPEKGKNAETNKEYGKDEKRFTGET